MNKKLAIKIILIFALCIGISVVQKSNSCLAQEEINENSPFGFLGSYIDNNRTKRIYQAYGGFGTVQEFHRDLGVHWSRGSGKTGGAIWGGLEKNINNYRNVFDKYVRTAGSNNINLLITIEPGYSKKEQGHYLPHNLKAYGNFVKKLVARYPTVKYWQVHNEINGGVFWKDTPKNYARLLRVTSNAIREVNPNCVIVLGSSINIAERGKPRPINLYFEPILKELSKYEKKYFDVFDYHFFPVRNSTPELYYRSLDNGLNSVRMLLDKYGYDDTEIWITETMLPTTAGMNETEIQKLPEEYREITEKQHARALIKVHVSALAKGVKKVFWNKLTEGSWFDPMFDRCGLIKHPRFSGNAEKKLAYYTYKKMVETLEGSDWENIETIQEEDGIYIYKFIKHGRPVWIAWNNNKRITAVRLTLEKSSEDIKITENVPMYESGSEIVNYSTAFREIKGEILESYPEQLVFEIGENPVLVTYRR